MSIDRDDDLSLEDVLELARDAWDEEFHTACPGRVESYDASAQTADVTPQIHRLLPRSDGSVLREPFPTVRCVPVVWPRAGSWYLHAPLAAGDFVLLIMCERDIARWRQTAEASDPIDRRLHHLSHAVAIPGLYPATSPIGDAPTDALVLGKDGGSTVRIENGGEIKVGTSASQFVALANLVKARLDTIQAAFDAHVHPAGTLLDSLAGACSGSTAVPAAAIGALAGVAASKVKAE